MSFRPFNLDIRLFGIAAMACLMCVGISRAGDAGPQNIEIVPFRDPSLATNFNSSDSAEPMDSRNFQPLMPRAPHPTTLPRGAGVILPPPSRPPSPEEIKRELEIIDRRKNWVFATPEELMGTESASDSSDKGTQTDPDGKPTTVMQRYYQHLYDADHLAATNKLSKFDPASWTRTTNSALGADSPTGSSLFDASANPGIFQPAATHSDGFAAIFGPDPNLSQPSPEQVRSQDEQKTHMDDFKQLWGIDQPPAATAVSAPPPVPVNASTPQFGSLQGAAPAKIVGFSSPGPLVQPAAAAPPPTVTSSRSIAPPHSDFAPPERPF